MEARVVSVLVLVAEVALTLAPANLREAVVGTLLDVSVLRAEVARRAQRTLLGIFARKARITEAITLPSAGGGIGARVYRARDLARSARAI